MKEGTQTRRQPRHFSKCDTIQQMLARPSRKYLPPEHVTAALASQPPMAPPARGSERAPHCHPRLRRPLRDQSQQSCVSRVRYGLHRLSEPPKNQVLPIAARIPEFMAMVLVPTLSSGSRQLQSRNLLEKFNYLVPTGNQDSRQFAPCDNLGLAGTNCDFSLCLQWFSRC